MKAEPTKTGSLSKTGERQFVAGDSGKTCQRDWQCMLRAKSRQLLSQRVVELIFRARFSTALPAACPIYVVFLTTIAFAIYFPSVVLWLPKQVLPASVGCFPNPDGPGYICPP